MITEREIALYQGLLWCYDNPRDIRDFWGTIDSLRELEARVASEGIDWEAFRRIADPGRSIWGSETN